ncbi:type IV secretion system protein VirD4 [Sphingomonas laterariae]|uniref:Type IV secretion system protein VirD4 n=2 Tax=Edaphosphingomonas laterariae TaxID=861865 RepID=A0A239KSS9_9SPHN|nr:type IV secretion system protein VirD4 [Sphingomonas laterariae]
MLEKTDFQLNDLLAGQADIFIVVPLDMVDAQSVFLRLMINIVTGAIVRESGRRNLPKPLLLVLDEFVRLGRMETLLNIATVGAGVGIEALFVTQDLGQVEQVYGKGDANTLLGACATTRVFGLGRTETATAERLVAGFGDKTVEIQSASREDERKGSRSEQKTKLFTVADLLEMPLTDMIAMFAGKPPLRLKLIVSHDDRAYRDKLDKNPTLRV